MTSLSRVIKSSKNQDVVILNYDKGQPTRDSGDKALFSTLFDLVPEEIKQNIRDTSGLKNKKKSPPSPSRGKKRPNNSGNNLINQTQQQATQILEKARQEAEAIKKRAEEFYLQKKKAAEELESQAYEKGFEQGQKDGKELGSKQFEAMAQRLDRLISNLQNQGKNLGKKYEAQIVNLSILMASRMVNHELSIKPELVVSIVKRALRHVVEGTSLKLHLNPADAELIEKRFMDRLSPPGKHKIELVTDPKITRGGCLLETKFGLIDATTETRWEEISRSIDQVLSQNTGYKLNRTNRQDEQGGE